MRRAVVALAMFAAAGGVTTATARDRVQPKAPPHGRALGVVHVRAGIRARAAAGGNLSPHAGVVMHSNETWAIYWAPPGSAFPDGYVQAIDAYLADVATDSGRNANVYGLDAQYGAPYDSHFAGHLMTSDPPPLAATSCAPYAGVSQCVTDDQIQAEVDQVVSANGLPRGLGDVYLVFTPQGVGTCDGSGACAYGKQPHDPTGFCGYHSWFGSGSGTTLYADLPFANVPACFAFSGNTDAQATINIVSHEHNETITDPTGRGWFDDADGSEDGDKCAFDLGGSTAIGAGSYDVQEEWDNATGACQPRPYGADFQVSPLSPATGGAVSFDASDTSFAPQSYQWSFGDGSSPSTLASPTHTFPGRGTYTVTLTVTDPSNQQWTDTRKIVVDPAPSAAFTPPSPAYAGGPLTFDGRSSSAAPGGQVSAYRWDFGDGTSAVGATPAHTYAHAGTYTASLTVLDDLGRASPATTQQVTVTTPPAPRPAFTVTPGSPAPGQAVTLDATSSSDPFSSLTYGWSLGDGTSATGPVVTHAFAAAGSYQVALTATDGFGTAATATRTVIVARPSNGSGTRSGGRPSIRVAALAPHALRALLRRGAPLRVACSSACAVSVRLLLDARTARRLGLGRGRAAWTVSSPRSARAAATVTLVLRTGARTRRALRALRSIRPTLVVQTRDRAGRTATLRRAVLMRR